VARIRPQHCAAAITLLASGAKSGLLQRPASQLLRHQQASMSSHGGSHGASRVGTKQTSGKSTTGSADHVLHLINLCKDAFSSFKPSMTTVDAHIDEVIERAGIDNDGDGLFLQQVVYGMVRYKKMLKVLLTALYFKHGSEVSRDDYGMYMIYAYAPPTPHLSTAFRYQLTPLQVPRCHTAGRPRRVSVHKVHPGTGACACACACAAADCWCRTRRR